MLEGSLGLHRLTSRGLQPILGLVGSGGLPASKKVDEWFPREEVGMSPEFFGTREKGTLSAVNEKIRGTCSSSASPPSHSREVTMELRAASASSSIFRLTSMSTAGPVI